MGAGLGLSDTTSSVDEGPAEEASWLVGVVMFSGLFRFLSLFVACCFFCLFLAFLLLPLIDSIFCLSRR